MKTLYFIHGFATGPSIWQKQIEVFLKDYRVILDQEQIKPNDELYIIGWSMGGWKAIELLFELRQKVSGLILVSAFAKYVQGNDYPYGQPLALLQKLERRFLIDYKLGMHYFYNLIFPDKDQQRIIDALPPPEKKDLLRWFEKLRLEDKREFLPRVNVPTLIIQGDKDPIVTVKSARYLQQSIPGSKLEIFGGVGHAPFLEQPDKFNACLKDFVG
ncbi:MAG: alpha/beta fold hydrolase [Candidatus Margulisbacteria bacterium]|nr:alpha/beta fold hydrolase [Candidatus Margulisiibacteriota bacterium]